MNVVVIGRGTDLIDWKNVAILRQSGHEVVAVSPIRLHFETRRSLPRAALAL
jgi:hypothetical protein